MREIWLIEINGCYFNGDVALYQEERGNWENIAKIYHEKTRAEETAEWLKGELGDGYLVEAVAGKLEV